MKSYIEYFKHIICEINFVLDNNKGSFDGFFLDERLKRAFVRSLEIIGEAVKNIPNDIKMKYTGVHWKEIAGTRDRLIHGYMDVDYEIVWDVAKNELPELKRDIEKILNTEDKEG